jgi:predicted DNA-binding transcriptional regulator AlpA
VQQTDPAMWQMDDVARETGLSRPMIERLRGAAMFPAPDRTVGRVRNWRPETIRAWVATGNGPTTSTIEDRT